MKVTPGCKVTFRHPGHGSTIQAKVCRTHVNGILCKTRNAFWALPHTAVLSVEPPEDRKPVSAEVVSQFLKGVSA